MGEFEIKPVTGGNGLTPWHGGMPSQATDLTGSEIFLINHHVAGTAHVPDPATLTADLALGQQVRLLREKNAYDAFATRVETLPGRKLGYLPKRENIVIARLLDAGLNVYAKITDWTMKGNWPYVRLDIFLKL
ncbi:MULTISPECIES: HIRAN domain-containing protein [unclassified Lacticaseibacillus]|uniref:HIRAN domain-containing protein n=1 Tax=unclassified Lacticaseibacillus TaxID=2759744 RepID=UPI001944BE30|nr:MULTISPECIES: HIRAN domain-containing protein [unclassified Lacticaseibacillus]